MERAVLQTRPSMFQARPRRRYAWLAALAALLAESEALAQPAIEPTRADDSRKVPLAWNPDWPRFRTSEYFFSAGMAAVAFGSLALPSVGGTWTGVNSFDEDGNEALRADTLEGQERARDASDVVISLMYNHLAVDAFVVAWWKHDNRDTAWQMAMIDLEVLAVTGAITNVTKALAGRERPYAANGRCVGPTEDLPDDCDDIRRNRSFFSGHSSSAFAIATVTCMHHAHLPLYGGRVPDVLACLGSLGAATTVAATRVMADEHYPTDVLTGAAVGALTGLTLPWLLHYRGGALPDGDTASPIDIRVVPTPTGGGIVGRF